MIIFLPIWMFGHYNNRWTDKQALDQVENDQKLANNLMTEKTISE